MGGAAGAAIGVGGSGLTSALSNIQEYYIQQRLMDQQYDEQKKLMDYQMQNMYNMFPFTNMISENATDFYGNNWGQIEDYLRHPTPPSNLERQLFEFFGGTVPEKGYYRTGGGKKGGPGALTNRLLGRYGAGESGPLAGQGIGMLEEASDWLRDLVPYAWEWAEGFPTEIKPIQDYAMRMFEREMMPEAAERFGGNIQGSGFQSEMGRTMGDVASELGAMEVMLNEAAAQRRMQGLSGPIQNLFTGPMNLETAFATAAAQAGQNYIDRVDAARPGAAMLGAMPMFANIDQGQGFIQQGFPTSGTDYGNIMSGWGQAASGVGNALANIDWGKLFGGDDDYTYSGYTVPGWGNNQIGGTDLFTYQGDPMAGIDSGPTTVGGLGSLYE